MLEIGVSIPESPKLSFSSIMSYFKLIPEKNPKSLENAEI